MLELVEVFAEGGFMDLLYCHLVCDTNGCITRRATSVAIEHDLAKSSLCSNLRGKDKQQSAPFYISMSTYAHIQHCGQVTRLYPWNAIPRLDVSARPPAA